MVVRVDVQMDGVKYRAAQNSKGIELGLKFTFHWDFNPAVREHLEHHFADFFVCIKILKHPLLNYGIFLLICWQKYQNKMHLG